MKTKLARILVLAAMLLSLFAPATIAQAKADVSAQVKGTSPQGFLNPDGSLKLDGSFNGSLNLSGYSVQLDPQRGPIFAPSQAAPAPGQWGYLGGGGGAIQGMVMVSAVAVNGAKVYVGGNFKNVNGIPAADYIAMWNGSSWSALGSNGAGDGSLVGSSSNLVDALALDASGNLYVGGNFTDVNNNGTVLTAADYIAKWDGTNWSALGSNGAGNGSLSNMVADIKISGSNVYIAGAFTNVNNNGSVLSAADYVARWDGANWYALGGASTGDGSLNNQAYRLAIYGSTVYVGGNFTDVKNGATTLTAADYIAQWDGSNWSALGSDGAGNGALNAYVDALTVDASGNLYVGGNFTDVHNGILTLSSADYIARWNGSFWYSLGTGAAPTYGALNNTVYAIAVIGADVYASGAFTNVNNAGTILTAAGLIAQFDGSNWSSVGSDGAGHPAVQGAILAMAVNGTTLYAGGAFPCVNINGTLTAQAANLAQWNGANWSAVATGVNGALNDDVYTIAVSGTDVYVGGSFTNVVNQGVVLPAADYIAKWDTLTSKWSALGSNGAGNGALSSRVNTIAVSGSTVYVGGNFTDVNNNGTVLTAADYIAKWDGTNWSALGSGTGGNGSINGNVDALAVSGSNLYVGGYFSNVNDQGAILNMADFIAKWDGAHWSALGSNGAGDGALTVSVNSLAVVGANLYVGGQFENVNNNGTLLNAARYLAKWNGANWSAVSSNGAGGPSLNCPPWTMAVSGTTIYAGGCFTDVNNNGTELPAANYVAKLDTLTGNWSALGSNGAGGGSINNVVDDIIVNGADVYVSGRFSNVNDKGTVYVTAANIAKFDTTKGNWSALGNNGAGGPAVPGEVGSMGVVGGTGLYVGGSFTDVNNNGTLLPEADYVAVYGILPKTLTVGSTAAYDGWMLESTATSNVGGTFGATGTLRVGDDASKKQYRSILYFNTANLPDNAVIRSVTLKIYKAGVVGTDPLTLSAFGSLLADMQKGTFGAAALEKGDFQATASASAIGHFSSIGGGWYQLTVPASDYKYVNLTGATQFRLRFNATSNKNNVADYDTFDAGEAASAYRPVLTVEYNLP